MTEKEYVDGLLRKIERLQAERDAAMREASELAMSIWRAEFQKLSPEFELCDSPAGVISQIDNMYAAMRAERDALVAKDVLLHKLWLAAQPDIIRLFEIQPIFGDNEWEIDGQSCHELQKAFATTPQQCLRDVQAEAVRTFVDFNKGRFTNAFDMYISEAFESYVNSMWQGGGEK